MVGAEGAGWVAPAVASGAARWELSRFVGSFRQATATRARLSAAIRDEAMEGHFIEVCQVRRVVLAAQIVGELRTGAEIESK